ncbi:reverse transcriptase domain-containing protein [Flavobacterium sp. UBA7682]|uniref:reverse transcriptase domain-containing protein n=1 Tax=Flavobacterium sp. UBA7682 TaxID=1946560 RepID=UPI0025C73DB3|nr:reverse transcriptase domain-containing protein [Flavobacterium sp. UBA7682]
MKNFNLGNFIKLNHVEKAFELIKLQIEDNTFSFKTLELEIYRIEEKINDFNCEEFYDELLKKDILYNKNNQFYNIEYLVPKGVYGVRKFNFLSFELLLIYYTLGFYFYDLIKESFETIENKKEKRLNISTYYGGKIDFNSPKKSSLYYQKDYVEFNNIVNKKIEDILGKKKKVVLIKLDIQDYFKSIDLEILLDIIKKYSIPSNTKKQKFDYSTIEEIKNLLIFINKSLIGVPLFSQNILSNFLSYLYLFELDNFVQEIPVSREEDFLYCRYVDDFYLIFKRNKTLKNDKIGDEIFNITTSISEFLHNNLSLKINQLKTQTLIIENSHDFETFIKKEKIISIPETLKKDKKPKERLEEIKEIIDQLKVDYKLSGKISISTEDSNKLKEIFSKALRNYLATSDAKSIVDKMFIGWNPILTLTSSQALIYLLKHSKENKLLKNFLIENKEFKLSNPQYLYLLEKYLLSNDHDENFNNEILNAHENNSYLNLIRKMMDKTLVLTSHNDLSISETFLEKHDTLMQQIKMLVIAETEGKFNLAFNHLLNIYHYFCFANDSSPSKTTLKNYNQNNVTDYLDSLKLPIEYLNFSIKFFDRRNKNNISHPGEELMESWVVNREEYTKYKNDLNKLLKQIQEYN